MGFTVETRPGPALAIKAGKNNRTPVFVDLDGAAAAEGQGPRSSSSRRRPIAAS